MQILLNILFYFSSILLIVFNQFAYGQTIGLLKKTENVADGYTLFSPVASNNTYLIDNCGHEVHKWGTSYNPGQTAYLRPDGSLVRTGRIDGAFTGGGIGGRVEIYDWENKLLWYSEFATDTTHQHHVVHPMPNGNLLVAIFRKYSQEDAIKHGFNTQKVTDAGIWSDKILEIAPRGINQYDIVWEWDFWDHVIQDKDATKNNFGIVKNHPELLDVNFIEDPGSNPAEWIHLNALDYDGINDLILISSRLNNEIYIIDHSTSIEEAKSHAGGKYGKGGDFLFRWGNPQAYRRGANSDHALFGQHDARFLDQIDENKIPIILYNNGSNRPGVLYSTVVEIIAEKENNQFLLDNSGRYKPESITWQYPDIADPSFYSARISGVHRLKNGHTLICEGNKGLFTEIDKSKQIVWQYKNPINNFGPNQQGNQINNNSVFNVRKYPPDYEAFIGKTLEGTPIEIGTSVDFCKKLTAVDSDFINDLGYYPNPTADKLTLELQDDFLGNFIVYDLLNQKVLEGSIDAGKTINLNQLDKGLYIIKIWDKNLKIVGYIKTQKI